jgi:LEA14-like dessication related protein
MDMLASRRQAWRAAPLAALLWLAGCSALLGRYEAPSVQVQGVEMLGGDLRHQRLRVHLAIDNPNKRALSISTVTYQVALAGTPLASGQSTAPFSVPAAGQGSFDLDVEADFAEALRIVGEHLREGKVDYQVVGRVKLASGWMPELPFTGRGQLPLF